MSDSFGLSSGTARSTTKFFDLWTPAGKKPQAESTLNPIMTIRSMRKQETAKHPFPGIKSSAAVTIKIPAAARGNHFAIGEMLKKELG
jgi:hypothetical protein